MAITFYRVKVGDGGLETSLGGTTLQRCRRCYCCAVFAPCTSRSGSAFRMRLI
jgi:hypothetical protein